MEVRIQAIHFDATEKLQDFIQKKTAKLEKYCDDINKVGFSTQKLMWRHRPFHGTSKIPFEIGLWQGVDGSRIMAVMDAHNYTTKWRYEGHGQPERRQRI